MRTRPVAIRLATSTDRAALAGLLGEMARHYGDPADAATIEAGVEALIHPVGCAGPFCLLAEQGGGPVGLVTLQGFYPAFDFTWGLLLQDLFVAESARGGRAARALMTAAASFAVARGYPRLDWTTDGGNARARAFYASCGVPVIAEVFYRIEGAVLAAAALGAWPKRLEGTAT